MLVFRVFLSYEFQVMDRKSIHIYYWGRYHLNRHVLFHFPLIFIKITITWGSGFPPTSCQIPSTSGLSDRPNRDPQMMYIVTVSSNYRKLAKLLENVMIKRNTDYDI